MAEYKLSYTAAEIDERLGAVDSMVKTINGVAPDENGNVEITIPDSSQNVALTTAQITALDNMFKVCAFVKDDVSTEYTAFKTAFGITDETQETTEVLSNIKWKVSGWPTFTDNGDGTYSATITDDLHDEVSPAAPYFSIIYPGTIAGGKLSIKFNKSVTSGAIGVVVYAVDQNAEKYTAMTSGSQSEFTWISPAPSGSFAVVSVSADCDIEMPDGAYPFIWVRNAHLMLDGDESSSNINTANHVAAGDITFSVTGVAESGGEETGVSNETKWTNGVDYKFTPIADEYPDKTTGEIKSYSGWTRTPYLYCEGASTLRITALATASELQGGSTDNAFYDIDKNYVGTFIYSSLANQEPGYHIDISIPENAAYFILSGGHGRFAGQLTNYAEGMIKLTPYE
jgi:hypothetical protein